MTPSSQIEITSLNYRILQVGDMIRVEYSWPESLIFGIVVDVQSPMKMIQIKVMYVEGDHTPDTWTFYFNEWYPSGRTVYKLMATNETNDAF